MSVTSIDHRSYVTEVWYVFFQLFVQLFELLQEVDGKDLIALDSHGYHVVPTKLLTKFIICLKDRIIIVEKSFSGGIDGKMSNLGNRKDRR